MKPVFVDIDGVLVPGAREDTHVFPDFEPACVACLNTLIRDTGAVIVLSSSWRSAHPRYLDLHAFFHDQGVEAEIFDFTPVLEACAVDEHGPEIMAWLEGRRERDDLAIEAFVVLDDQSVGLLASWCVRTDPARGLTAADVEAAVAILNGGRR